MQCLESAVPAVLVYVVQDDYLFFHMIAKIMMIASMEPTNIPDYGYLLHISHDFNDGVWRVRWKVQNC